MVFRQTFVKRDKIGIIANGKVHVLDFTDLAMGTGDLPHNSFVLTSTRATAVIEIYLDQPATSDNPDYTLQGKGNVVINPEDGIRFNVIYLINKEGADTVADDLQFRIGTVREFL